MHLYGEAARCVPEISNPRVVEGEPGRCTQMVELPVGAPACPRYKCNSQPTPTTSTQLVAPPFRCTCLLPFPNSSNKSLREHTWRLHHIGAPANPPANPLFYLSVDLSCHIPMRIAVLLPNS